MHVVKYVCLSQLLKRLCGVITAELLTLLGDSSESGTRVDVIWVNHIL